MKVKVAAKEATERREDIMVMMMMLMMVKDIQRGVGRKVHRLIIAVVVVVVVMMEREVGGLEMTLKEMVRPCLFSLMNSPAFVFTVVDTHDSFLLFLSFS
jgi:hypothetical protein